MEAGGLALLPLMQHQASLLIAHWCSVQQLGAETRTHITMDSPCEAHALISMGSPPWGARAGLRNIFVRGEPPDVAAAMACLSRWLSVVEGAAAAAGSGAEAESALAAPNSSHAVVADLVARPAEPTSPGVPLGDEAGEEISVPGSHTGSQPGSHSGSHSAIPTIAAAAAETTAVVLWQAPAPPSTAPPASSATPFAPTAASAHVHAHALSAPPWMHPHMAMAHHHVPFGGAPTFVFIGPPQAMIAPYYAAHFHPHLQASAYAPGMSPGECMVRADGRGHPAARVGLVRACACLRPPAQCSEVYAPPWV